MLRRRQINADPRAHRLRSALSAATAPLRRAASAIESQRMLRRRPINADRRANRLRSRLSAAAAPLRGTRWPFERLAWTVERRLLWPLSERTAGWSPSVGLSPSVGPSSPARRAAVGAALGAAAGVAIVVGVLVLSGEGEEGARRQAAAPVQVAAPASPPSKAAAQKPQGPALQGAPPSFGVGKGVGVAKKGGGNSGDATATVSAAPRTSTLESDEGGATGGAERGATASSSRAEPVPAGPAAMRVARRFAEAFVFYEIGKRTARAKTVFGETATPELAEALAERPPRLPEGARVPKARVVNVVPGPRLGRAYTVSVSLLRVGLTSELRLAMRKRHGGWLVTDVRG